MLSVCYRTLQTEQRFSKFDGKKKKKILLKLFGVSGLRSCVGR